MRTRTIAACLPFLVASVLLHSEGAAQTAKVPATGSAANGQNVPLCTREQLTLNTDGMDGDFDGMSHSGTLVVVRNLGPRACRLGPFPQITLYDATGPLKVTFSPVAAKFMPPGPVVSPAVVAAGAELTSGLRWVSGPVFGDNSVCVTPTSLHLTVGGKEMSTPLTATLCGDPAKGIQAEMKRLLPDPVYKPGE